MGHIHGNITTLNRIFIKKQFKLWLNF